MTAASVSRSDPLATSQGGATAEKSHRRNRTRPCVAGGATHASAAHAAAAQGSNALSTDASSKARAAAVAAAKPGRGDAGLGDAGRGDAAGAVDTRDAFLERMIRANANNNPEIGLRVDDLPGGRAADPRSDALCAICLDELAGKVVYETACAHAFCKGCIQSWIAHAPGAPTCPTCKAHLNIPRGR